MAVNGRWVYIGFWFLSFSVVFVDFVLGMVLNPKNKIRLYDLKHVFGVEGSGFRGRV